MKIGKVTTHPKIFLLACIVLALLMWRWHYWRGYMYTSFEEVGRTHINKVFKGEDAPVKGHNLECTPRASEESWSYHGEWDGYVFVVSDKMDIRRATRACGVKLPEVDLSRYYLVLTHGRALKSIRYARLSGVMDAPRGGDSSGASSTR